MSRDIFDLCDLFLIKQTTLRSLADRFSKQAVYPELSDKPHPAEEVAATRWGKPVDEETSQEINETVTDCLNIITILQRTFTPFKKDEEHMSDFSEIELLLTNLQKMEDKFNDRYFLETQLDTRADEPYELYDLREQAVTVRNLIKGLESQNIVKQPREWPDTASGLAEKSKLNLAEDLLRNIDKLADLVLEDSKLIEKDPRSVDEIHWEEMHPDMFGESEELSDIAYENSFGEPNDFTTDPKIREQRMKDRETFGPFNYYHNPEDD